MSKNRNAAALVQQGGPVQAESWPAAVQSGAVYTPITGEDLLAMPAPRWRVKGVLPETGAAAIFGQPRSGKTFLALDLCLSLAEGRSWLGLPTKPCAALYVNLESSWGLRQRLLAWMNRYNRKAPENLKFILDPLNLQNSAQVGAIIEVAPKCGVVVIDTLNRASPDADENSSRDMSSLIAAVDKIQRAISGLVILVAHSGKQATNGIRGHSSLLAALDASIEVVLKNDKRYLRLDKVKEGIDGIKRDFKLLPVVTGIDEGGADITSCVVVQEYNDSRQEDNEQKVDSQDKIAMPANLRYGLSSLDKALKQAGSDSIHLEAWRTVFYEGSAGDNTNAKKQAFYRARNGLVERREIIVRNDFYQIRPESVGCVTAVTAVTAVTKPLQSRYKAVTKPLQCNHVTTVTPLPLQAPPL
jgi:hypothetical protein